MEVNDIMDTNDLKEKTGLLRRIADKIFGGLNMSWPVVIIFAFFTAVLTAVIMIYPVFENTSLHYIGETVEAWILFAVIIMSNCKKPMESALKTLVFFLISQPLIYLFQVPFADMGWGLFGYYKYWFMWSLATFPMAFVGWFIKKRNWLSFIILLPVILYLSSIAGESFKFTLNHFPIRLGLAIFCLLQVLIYIYVFMSGKLMRLLGLVVTLGIIAFIMFFHSSLSVEGEHPLPEGIALTQDAVVVSENPELGHVELENKDITGDFSTVRIKADHVGESEFIIKDGDKEYHFSLKVYEDDGGSPQVRITEKE